MAIRKLVAILLPFAVLTVLGLSLGTPSQIRPLLPREPSSLDLPLPFQDGEQVTYQVNWKPWFLLPSLIAGEVTLNLEQATYEGTEVFKISASAVSGGAFQSLVGLNIRDHFESITDSSSFRSYLYKSETRHGRRQRDLEVRIDYERQPCADSGTRCRGPTPSSNSERDLPGCTSLRQRHSLSRLRDQAPRNETRGKLPDGSQ